MPLPDASPLNSEERALARRLAELHAAAEPSAALDAQVLAAARSAALRPAPRRRRWPAAVGLAASLLLAVGVAWQLRAPSALPPPPATGGHTGDDGGRGPQAVGSGPSAPPPMEAKRAMPVPERVLPRPEAPTPTEPAAPVVASSPEPSIALDRPAPRSGTVAPSPMVLPPPPLAPEPARQSEPDVPQPAAAAPAPPEAAVDQNAAREADQAGAETSGHGDEPEDDVPPATADSPAVRDAWLQRIQGFVGSGDIDAARTSLRAFVQRYPDYALPEDLRALTR